MADRYTFLFFAFTIALCGKGQQSSSNTWEWVNRFNFTGVEANAVIGGEDKDGNLYCAVRSVKSGAHQYEVYYHLLKLDPQGKMLWSKLINDYTRAAMVTDWEGNTYLAFNDRLAKVNSTGDFIWQKSTNTQRFFQEISFSNNKLVLTGVEKDGKRFVSKYDLSGELLSSAYGYKPGFAALDANLNCFVLGFDNPHPVTGNSARLWKFSNTGILQFEVDVPYRPVDIMVDRENSVYVTGYFGGEIEIDGRKILKPDLPNDYTYWQYLIKYNPAGKLLWYKILTGAGSNIGLQFDQQNNLYYSTNIYGESKLNESLINQSGPALLVAKINPDGNPIWYEKVEGRPGLENLFINSQNQAYLAGRFTGSFTAGTITAGPTEHYMYAEMFVAKLSQNQILEVGESPKTDNLWQIFPNPSGDIFTISGEKVENLHYSVTDIRGQVIQTSTDGEQRRVDLSGLANGVYLLQIRSGSRTETKKLVKN